MNADLARLLLYPRAYLVGLFGQLQLLPAAAFTVALLAGLQPSIAVGLMIIAAAPGGIASNVVTSYVRGNLGLSVLLTFTSSLVGVVTMPLIVSAALQKFGQLSGQVDFPVVDTIVRLFVISVLPLMLGMAIRRWNRAAADRLAAVADKSSVPFLLFVLAVLTAGSIDFLRTHLASVGLLVLGFLLLMLALSASLARLAQLDRADSNTVVIEIMLQNSSLALFVALDVLKSEEAAIVPGCYALLMLVLVGLLMVKMRTGRAAQA